MTQTTSTEDAGRSTPQAQPGQAHIVDRIAAVGTKKIASTREPAVAIQFDDRPHEYRATKLGMWIFLSTELMMFGGLFCMYAVYRANFPAIFEYGSQFLDRGWGAINTVVLILSSFTVAAAIYCAQTNRPRHVILLLTVTLILGIDFLGIKSVEYAHKFQAGLYPGVVIESASVGNNTPPVASAAASETVVAPAITIPGDATAGRRPFSSTCAGCHGQTGDGIAGVAVSLTESAFISKASDEELVAFLQKGRGPTDPASLTKQLMPARGGNPDITDQDLANIVAFVRQLGDGDGTGAELLAQPAGAKTLEEALAMLPKSFIKDASQGPAGLSADYLMGVNTVSVTPLKADKVSGNASMSPPARAGLFFSIYFLMTGLHGFHVIIGLGIIAWLLRRALRYEFNSRNFTAIEMGGLFWHLIDMIWIMLFPLLYLV